MRRSISTQTRLDCNSVANVELNLACRDEIVPILTALQHIYKNAKLRRKVLALIAGDVNKDSDPDSGREGMDYWQILVLTAVRLGCNLDYDRLQDLAENHRRLRHIMGIGDWQENVTFNWRTIRNNVCLLSTETITTINHLIVDEGHKFEPNASTKSRADSFVVETNTHYPTDSNLMYDGIRKVIQLSVPLAETLGVAGWRQAQHLLKRARSLVREIARLVRSKDPKTAAQKKEPYQRLLQLAKLILDRAETLANQAENGNVESAFVTSSIRTFIERTRQVASCAYRRVLLGERIPNADKLFSIFEPHTQLYRRGKSATPNQFGRLTLVYEDSAGFITHHYLIPRDQTDPDVLIQQTAIVQQRLGGRIEELSVDRGFHSPENESELANIIPHPCLPKRAPREFLEQQHSASLKFLDARQRHPGVESAIGALQSGNGMKRCRDRTEVGFERYLAIAILGRNLHVLGKILIQQRAPDSLAAVSKRQHVA